MRGLNNEQLAVMREVGTSLHAPARRKASRREAHVLNRLNRRKLVYGEWTDDGRIARMTKIGRLIYGALTSQRWAKGMSL